MSYNVCIISETKNLSNPESFIKAHKDYISGNIHFLYGSTFPIYSEKYGLLNNKVSLLKKLFIKLRIMKFVIPRESGLVKYLKNEDIDIVIAEFGTTGSQIFHICKELNIPLMVFFHGYDITINDVIEWHLEYYKNLFLYASKVFAVSKDMKSVVQKIK